MNHMKEVAKLLGVEIGEKFDIEGMGNYNPFMITEDGLFDSVSNGSCPFAFEGLIKGEEKIIKKPFKPKDDEKYYFILTQNEVCYRHWRGFCDDVAYYLMGNCFRTREEAEAHKEEILSKFREVDNGNS